MFERTAGIKNISKLIVVLEVRNIRVGKSYKMPDIEFPAGFDKSSCFTDEGGWSTVLCWNIETHFKAVTIELYFERVYVSSMFAFSYLHLLRMRKHNITWQICEQESIGQR